jgi:hypothetical protein
MDWDRFQCAFVLVFVFVFTCSRSFVFVFVFTCFATLFLMI